MLVNGVNVVLNFLLIYPKRVFNGVTIPGAGMGVIGAATASAIAFAVGGIVMTDWIVGMMGGRKDKYPWPNAARIAAAGNDLTMPGGKGDVNAILKGLQQRSPRKRLSRKQLQINATRIYRMAKYLTQAK